MWPCKFGKPTLDVKGCFHHIINMALWEWCTERGRQRGQREREREREKEREKERGGRLREIGRERERYGKREEESETKRKREKNKRITHLVGMHRYSVNTGVAINHIRALPKTMIICKPIFQVGAIPSKCYTPKPSSL